MNICVLILLLHISAVNPSMDIRFDTGANTVDEALTQLNEYFPDWRQNYKEGEFDCSEMSAFVYEYLKCCGLKPEIKNGYSGNYGHSWVVCDGKNIQCTDLRVVSGTRFCSSLTIREMRDDLKVTEYDWWNSEYIIKKAQCQ